MDWISLGTALFHLWVFIMLAGCAVAPAQTWMRPPAIQALVILLGGVCCLGLVGLASIVIDPSSIVLRVFAWAGLTMILGVRLWRRFRTIADVTGYRLDRRAAIRAAALSASLLLGFAYGTHLMSLAGSPPYEASTPWRVMTQRSYPLFDGDLQYLVADAFLDDANVEKNFYAKGSPWSAGDRPMALAVLYTAASQLTGEANLTHYRLVIVLLASFIVLAVFALLNDLIRLGAGASLLLAGVFAFHPFFVANIEFTWPKMAGAGFALMGFVLVLHELDRATRSSRFDLRSSWGILLLGGLGLGLAPVAHATLVVGFACLCLSGSLRL